MPSIYLGHKAFVEAGHDVLFVVPGPQARAYQYDGIDARMYEINNPLNAVERIGDGDD